MEPAKQLLFGRRCPRLTLGGAQRPEVKAFADWLSAQAVATREVTGEGEDSDLVNDLD